MEKKKLNVALVGYGFMGKAHSTAYLEAQRVFDLPVTFEMALIVGRNREACDSMRTQWGWKRYVSDWKDAVADPEIDLVDIATPNFLHREIAVAAAEQKKNVFCEKPLGLNVNECREMVGAVEAAKVFHMIWHNYRKAPAIGLAKRLISENRLGRIYHLRARFLQSWQIDPKTPWRWLHQKQYAGSGVNGDLNAHLIDMSRYLVGEITQVCGMMETFVKERPDKTGAMVKVDVDDACSFLARFENGAVGVIESSRMSTGRMVNNCIEINGEHGALYWDFEDMNSLYYFDNTEKPDRRGFKKIQALTAHHPYMEGHWSTNHALGYANTFINTLREFAISYDKNENPSPNFYDGLKNQMVIDAVISSVEREKWIDIGE